jgi:hypothetical protein
LLNAAALKNIYNYPMHRAAALSPAPMAKASLAGNAAWCRRKAGIM